MKKLDDAAYKAGYAVYASGATLRSVIEPILARDGASTVEQEERDMSRALGFVDAVLDRLRGISNR